MKEMQARTGTKRGSAAVGGSARRPIALSDEQERVLLEHMPVVRFLARRIHARLPYQVDMEDLVSAGVVGLLDAFQKFEPAKNVQFQTYAQFRIRGEILDSLRTLDWSPRDLRRKGRVLQETVRTLMAGLCRAPDEAEIAVAMRLELEEYRKLLGDLKGLELRTLSTERHDESGDEELNYVIDDDPNDNPLFRYLGNELEERLAETIANLPSRERLVITLYYYEEMTMREIGLVLGLVESRISQIRKSAVAHLRRALEAVS